MVITEINDTYRLLARYRFTWIAGLILCVIPVLIIIFDQTSTNLGFISISQSRILGYEFAVLVGLPACHLSAWLMAYAVRRRVEETPGSGLFVRKADPRTRMWGTFTGALAINWALLIPPLAIICLYDALSGPVINCDYPHGFAHYLLTAFLGVWLSTSITFFVGVLVNRPGKAYFIFLAVFILSFLLAAMKLFWGPRVVINEAFSGIIFLPMYSFDTPITTGYVLGRLLIIFYTSILVNLGIVACSKDSKYCGLGVLQQFFKNPLARLPESQMIFLSLIILVSVSFFRGPLNIEVSRKYLESELDGMVVTEHFIIRYPTHSRIGEFIGQVIESHEFYYYQVTKRLGIESGPVIRAYLYPTEDEKIRLTGAGASVFAKPWNDEIHVLATPDGEIESLKHELVHVIAGEWYDGFLNVPTNFAFAEGLAESINWMPQLDMTADQWAAAFTRTRSDGSETSISRYHVTPEQLFQSEAAFSMGISTANYFTAASFTRFIMDKYGVDLYAEAYGKGSARAFEPIYNKTLHELNTEWEEYIDSIPLQDDALDYAEFSFRSGPFSEMKCAHVIATHILAARRYQAGRQFGKALAEYRMLTAKAPENIQWGFSVLNALYMNGEYQEALEYASALFEYPDLIPSWEARINLRIGDCHARLGDPVSAADYYRMALNKAVTSNLIDTAELKLKAVDNPAMFDYILQGLDQPNASARWYFEKAAQENEDSFIPMYLLGTSLITDKNYKEALPYVENALSLDIPVRSYARTLHYYRGICLYRLERYNEAIIAFSEASRIEEMLMAAIGRNDSVMMEIYRNWIEKCEWRQTWIPPEI